MTKINEFYSSPMLNEKMLNKDFGPMSTLIA